MPMSFDACFLLFLASAQWAFRKVPGLLPSVPAILREPFPTTTVVADSSMSLVWFMGRVSKTIAVQGAGVALVWIGWSIASPVRRVGRGGLVVAREGGLT